MQTWGGHRHRVSGGCQAARGQECMERRPRQDLGKEDIMEEDAVQTTQGKTLPAEHLQEVGYFPGVLTPRPHKARQKSSPKALIFKDVLGSRWVSPGACSTG